jgi:predicted MFS family arabinose efflux permease
MMALWSAGSVLGGLVYGAGRRTVHPLALALTLAVLTVPAALAHSPLLLGAAVFVAGLPCAPALSSITATVVPEERRGEAMGWQGTAMTIGGSLGAPLCGWMIDAGGPGAGFLTAAVVGGLLAAGGLVALRVSRARSVGAGSLETAAVS